MDQRGLYSGTTGYRPYPPTNNAQVRWVQSNVVQVQTLVEVADTPAHRNGISLIIGKFLTFYLTGAQNDFKTAAKRQETVIQAFQDDLVKFPLWAIEDGLTAYRRSENGKWCPKVSGEVVEYISMEYHKVTKVLKNCRRILTANERGLNVDIMAAGLEAIADPKERAEIAQTMMHRLEMACEVYVDPVARDFHHKCYDTFHTWRRENAKKLADAESQNEDQEAGADDPDRGIFPSNPPDASPKIP